MSTAQKLLETVYKELDFQNGDLIATDLLQSDNDWLDKGDWAMLAKQAGAEKILFVQGNPVVVFAKSGSDEPDDIRKLFNNIWCMARPNLLFLASPGELSVYDLTRKPVHKSENWEEYSPLDKVQNISDVADKLKDYHRAQIESGKLFEDERFGSIKQRADKSLIQNLRTVRASLILDGLANEKLKYAHTLIGRSIFIRYLEDRGILTLEYFKKLTRGKPKWHEILNSPPSANTDLPESCYVKILANKEFTYALFNSLANDFNGDMFPNDEQEKKHIKQKHLKLLQGFLQGDTEEQQNLFFWAYKFDIIPIELVSSIYEEFYTTESGGNDDKGTHYTPSSLVEFILNQTLTRERLETDPVILDPACGSGIFLVEAFRRIVRYRTQKGDRRLSPIQLRKILREQIRGIDINEEAIGVAAFSLYLALLHYQEPKDILEQIKRSKQRKPLPCLVKLEDESLQNSDTEYFDILQVANAFDQKADLGNDNKVDIVVGNPPWGRDKEDSKRAKIALEWCKERDYPVGRGERSQSFIWRAIDLTKENGCVALLVSSGVLHNVDKSKDFRKKWLQETSLQHIIHFAHVRKVFFTKAIFPFAAVIFNNKLSTPDNQFAYSSAKMSRYTQSSQSVLLGLNDIRWLRQGDFQNNDTLWKIYWLAGHRDAALLDNLKVCSPLKHLKGPKGNLTVITGRGYERCGNGKSSGWLKNYKILPTNYFTRSNPVEESQLDGEIPEKVHRIPPSEKLVQGARILFKNGVQEKNYPKGHFLSRFEEKDYAFNTSIYGIKIEHANTIDYLTILGALWSSFARYYFFLTSAQWGTINHKLRLEELQDFPIIFPVDKGTQRGIVAAVKALQKHYRKTLSAQYDEASLQHDLDEAVFDAYEFSQWERDQIRDMCEVGLPFFYDSTNSNGALSLNLQKLPSDSGVASNLIPSPEDRTDIRGYLAVFLKTWNRELEPDGEFSWQVIAPGYKSPMVAVVFSIQENGATPEKDLPTDEQAWDKVLRKLSKNLRTPFYSNRIYVDGLVRAVSSTQIIIIKRNEGRFWTRSAAREDVEATLLKAMQLDDKSGEFI